MKKLTTEPAFIGTSATAALFSKCEATIIRWVAEGKLECRLTDKGHRVFDRRYIEEKARHAAA